MQIRVCENRCVLSIQTKYKIKFGSVQARICAFIVPALVDFLGAISHDAPAVVCHHVSVPSALAAMFHSHEVLMQLLPWFISNSHGVTGEFIKVTIKEMQLDTHFTPKVAIS